MIQVCLLLLGTAFGGGNRVDRIESICPSERKARKSTESFELLHSSFLLLPVV
jgi:hypothetical protein